MQKQEASPVKLLLSILYFNFFISSQGFASELN